MIDRLSVEQLKNQLLAEAPTWFHGITS